MTDLFDLPEGRRLRDEGTTLAASHEVPWSERARTTIDRLAGLGYPFTADDVTRLAGLPESRNAVGAAFIGAARRGVIVRAGDRQSARKDRHAGRQTLWQGVTAP